MVTCHRITYSQNNRSNRRNININSNIKLSSTSINSKVKSSNKNITSNLKLIKTDPPRPPYSGSCHSSLEPLSESTDDQEQIIFDSISNYLHSYASSTSNEFLNTDVIRTLTSIITANAEYILSTHDPLAKDEIVVATQQPVVLPRKSSEYDRKILKKTLAHRRNAIVVEDTSTFLEVLSLYMALSNNLWLVEILTSDKST